MGPRRLVATAGIGLAAAGAGALGWTAAWAEPVGGANVRTLYEAQCATCHGREGRGDGPAAYLLYPRPRDFGEGKFRLVSTDNGVPTDEDLFHTITLGIPRSAMPAWAHLPEGDRRELAPYVRGLARDGYAARLLQLAAETGDETTPEEARGIARAKLNPGTPWTLPPESPQTLESLIRGRQVFMEQCAQCHGADGRGTGRDDLKDDKGMPIRARDYTRGIFKGGKTSENLARRILSGIPGTPMPSFSDKFGFVPGRTPEADDLWALVHYVQSLIRPGAQELAEQGRKTLAARRVESLPSDPADTAWRAAPSTYLALMHLWWNDERPDGVLVRALHDGKRLALHLTWEDRAANGHVLRQEAFSDAAAVQFSPSPTPPLFTMGSPESPVALWHWKAHWQADREQLADVETTHPHMAVDLYDSLRKPPYGVHAEVRDLPAPAHQPLFLTGWGAGNLQSTPDRPSPVESLVAKGFGTLTSLPAGAQRVGGGGAWQHGFWRVVFVRDLAAAGEDAFAFAPGRPVSVSFAVWDGDAGDRDGQKSVTMWHPLTLE